MTIDLITVNVNIQQIIMGLIIGCLVGVSPNVFLRLVQVIRMLAGIFLIYMIIVEGTIPVLSMSVQTTIELVFQWRWVIAGTLTGCIISYYIIKK